MFQFLNSWQEPSIGSAVASEPTEQYDASPPVPNATATTSLPRSARSSCAMHCSSVSPRTTPFTVSSPPVAPNEAPAGTCCGCILWAA